MAGTAQLLLGRRQEGFTARSMRVVAGHAVLERGWVEDRLSRLGRIVMTLDAELTRVADQQLRVLRAVAAVTVDALLGGGVRVRTGDRLGDRIVTGSAESPLIGQQKRPVIGGVRIVTEEAVPLGGRRMNGPALRRRPIVAVQAEPRAVRGGSRRGRLVAILAFQVGMHRGAQKAAVR
jgi:hypothetical protein